MSRHYNYRVSTISIVNMCAISLPPLQHINISDVPRVKAVLLFLLNPFGFTLMVKQSTQVCCSLSSQPVIGNDAQNCPSRA